MFPVRDHNPSDKFPLLVVTLVIVNTLIFLLEIATPNFETFIGTYALTPALVSFSDISSLYPFITSMYLHGGFLHLASNMWFLWIFGDNIEASLGHLGFFFFYTISGVGAAFLQYLISPSSNIPMLGASGAIAGILGAYLVFFPKAKIDTYIVSFGGFLHQVQMPAYFMLIYWFVIQLFAGATTIVKTASTGGVAWWAHVGGFAVGWTIANILGGEKSIEVV